MRPRDIGLTSQCGPNGRHDKPPPPAVVRVASDKRANERKNKEKDIAIAIAFATGT